MELQGRSSRVSRDPKTQPTSPGVSSQNTPHTQPHSPCTSPGLSPHNQLHNFCRSPGVSPHIPLHIPWVITPQPAPHPPADPLGYHPKTAHSQPHIPWVSPHIQPHNPFTSPGISVSPPAPRRASTRPFLTNSQPIYKQTKPGQPLLMAFP